MLYPKIIWLLFWPGAAYPCSLCSSCSSQGPGKSHEFSHLPANPATDLLRPISCAYEFGVPQASGQFHQGDGPYKGGVWDAESNLVYINLAVNWMVLLSTPSGASHIWTSVATPLVTTYNLFCFGDVRVIVWTFQYSSWSFRQLRRGSGLGKRSCQTMLGAWTRPEILLGEERGSCWRLKLKDYHFGIDPRSSQRHPNTLQNLQTCRYSINVCWFILN